MIPLRPNVTLGRIEQQRHAETCCITLAGFIHNPLNPVLPLGRAKKWRHGHLAHTVPYQQELIFYWWNDYQQVFPMFARFHIDMLNNLVGRPVVEMQTQVGLKLFSNTSILPRRISDWLHTWCPSLLLWHEKWLVQEQALVPMCIFGEVITPKGPGWGDI